MLKKIFFIVIFLLIICFLGGGYFFYSTRKACNNLVGTKEFILEKGEGVNQISQKLKSEGLICNRFVFEIYVRLKGKEAQFKAGRHYLPKKVDIRELVNLLTSGQSLRNETTIQILEGWTINEIADYLADRGVVKKEEFLEAAKFSKDYQYNFLSQLNQKDLEGYLFPDTYRIYHTATAKGITEKMLVNFDKKVSSPLQAEIEKQSKNLSQVIILASIVEEEANSQEDREKIADIFWRRISAGIPLQADSTVNYVTGKKTPAISYEDTQIDSPYNTYKYVGLPPAPICNPGLVSIKAVIYPQKNDFWYFLSTKDGKILYSKNFKEHTSNKAKYLN